MPRSPSALILIVILGVTLSSGPAAGWDLIEDDAQAIAFFESSIRPILFERCVSCHGPDQQKGGLRLDSRIATLEIGGDSGPPVEPGEPDESLMIEAIRYDSFVQMPPSSKLPDSEIVLLFQWVEMGAPWPIDSNPGDPTTSTPFDIEARSAHWSLHPLADPPIPDVLDDSWSRNPIDRFLLARLDLEGIEPAPEAPRSSLLRRVSYGLAGLPPDPELVQAFLNDNRPDAYERLVDRVLESPRYGERWARHWLDLVRFAETSGHEFDYDILTAHRYRDYVIRAFNADLPYDQFVIEHLAGDLLDTPRRHPSLGSNESILGTMSFFFVEGTHSPVDITEEMRTRVDNQIDVLSKTFLGLTIACARCHDHKFDAISTRDYYAFAGLIQSTRHQYAVIDSPDTFDRPVALLDSIRSSLAAEIERPQTSSPRSLTLRGGDSLFDDFSSDSFDDWFSTGPAFGTGPTRAGDLMIDPEGNLRFLAPNWAHSGSIDQNLVGVLRSRTFAIDHPYYHFLATGTGGQINLVVDGFEKIRSPIYGGLTQSVVHGDEPRWVSIDASMWIGHLAYFELADGATSDYTGGIALLRPGLGDIAVGLVLSSDHREPPHSLPEPPGPVIGSIPRAELSESARTLIERYQILAESLPDPTLALVAADGTGIDVPVHIRGSAKNLGDVVPRGFLTVLEPEDSAPSSDRLTLARRLVSAENPLVARVMVNRIWAHHFGRGLVASTDDFGLMGTLPSHPELLDWLATEFIRSGWSIKHMHRLIMTSSAYRMSSRLRSEVEAIDPSNLLLHRANRRRLEAEPIRDAMLSIAGNLDPTLFGPSVAPHLTPFMEGRGRPQESGPLDGNGRRSLYLNVRRNFLPPFLLAFDFPTPATTRGSRDVSNVPSQSLALMNDPFVHQQARLWADRLSCLAESDPDGAIDSLVLAAYSRPPTPVERSLLLDFLDASPDPWPDLCLALFNSKAFLYLD